ncbi:hypothetical protein [Stenotrophomonas sp. ZAC14A_NAIMI4_1]|uniref:hypothetical protein n=1 Tax=Stenotrophomonas sp. ZAC14A_NAIMI4_1 TaxID=2072412 RepID=UPI000D53E537|nr:hypothetical protein [Stenotrophomonas sp. ZAC14A_NAIMI4_1]AWH45410.1 hypothetical protein C1926_10405 [Stenotrophomonas sp. ZAC14A_NAIMI4_1]
MNAETVAVSNAPGIADGVLSATITDTWFDSERTAHILDVARRIERLHAKASRRLSDLREELDEALVGHPLEHRLRQRLLAPLESDCLELETVAARVRVRLSLFGPAQSQGQFDRGMALQLADLRAEPAAAHGQPERGACAPTVPLGYWISEEDFNRVERACAAALLLSSVDERMGLPLDAVAFSAAYVHEDLAAVLAGVKHSSQMETDDDAD